MDTTPTNPNIFLALKNDLPIVTCCIVAIKVILYNSEVQFPWLREEICLSLDKIFIDKDFKRFFLSSFDHVDLKDFGLSMASFSLKGKALERKYGALKYFLLLLFLMFFTNIFYLTFGAIIWAVSGKEKVIDYCAAGFAGIVFAMKVLTVKDTSWEDRFMSCFYINIPDKYACWIELIAMRLIVPSTSNLLVGSGLAAGLLYIAIAGVLWPSYDVVIDVQSPVTEPGSS